jgi:hypothetical protein
MKLALTAATIVVATACSDSARHDNPHLDASSGDARATDAGHHGTKPDAAQPPPPTQMPVAMPHDAAASIPLPDVPIIAPPSCSGDPPVVTAHDLLTNTELAPDFGCYERARTDAGADRDSGLDAGRVVTKSIAFRTVLRSLLEGVTVDFFSGSSTLGIPSSTQVLGGDGGAVTFSLPSTTSVLSVRVHALQRSNAAASVVEMREYGFRLSGERPSIDGFAVVSDSRALAVRLALGGSGQEDPSKALLIADVRDCTGHPVNGAQVDLIEGDTNRPVSVGTAADAPHVAYSYFALPTPMCTFTSDQQEGATWMMVNAPVNVVNGSKTRPYRVRVSGRRQATDSAPVVIVEREVELFAGLVSFVQP